MTSALEIEATPTPMQLVDNGGCLTVVVDAEMPLLTAELVRDTLERVRR